MHIQQMRTKVGNKTYASVLLRESYREGKQVKKRTLANLTNWDPDLVAALNACLKGRRLVDADSIQIGPGRAFGASFVFATLAKSLGVADALGSSRPGRLALMMAVLRPIKPVSKLGTVAVRD